MQGRVGVHDPNERDLWEVEPLGDHLRADEDPHLARAKLGQGPLVAAGLLHRVGIHPQAGHVSKSGPHLGFEPLRPQATVVDAGKLALGTHGRRRHFKIAVVAQHDLGVSMMRERQFAVGTLHDLATLRALDVRREAASIEQQDDLSPLVERVPHGKLQLAADRATKDLLARFVAQVDRQHVGQRPIEDALRQLDKPILADSGAVPTLERWRGRPEHQRHPFIMGAPGRDIARVIAGRGVLLERRLVFLVEHDHAQLRDRREDGAPRADDHVHLA